MGIIEKAEELQKECFKFTEDIIKEDKIPGEKSYQDLVNAWVYTKLAEYELRIAEIESDLEFNRRFVDRR